MTCVDNVGEDDCAEECAFFADDEESFNGCR